MRDDLGTAGLHSRDDFSACYPLETVSGHIPCSRPASADEVVPSCSVGSFSPGGYVSLEYGAESRCGLREQDHARRCV